jgi:hypothetical protein
LARKVITKVVLSKEQKEILNQLKTRLGTSESETMRMALMDYAKEVNMLSETIQRKRQDREENTENNIVT